jgi:hypothetical protein
MSIEPANLEATTIAEITKQFSVSGELTESELSSLVKQVV